MSDLPARPGRLNGLRHLALLVTNRKSANVSTSTCLVWKCCTGLTKIWST